MKKLFALLLLPLVVGCGPIYGQLMRLNEGIKDFTVVSGRLDTLQPGSTIVVAAPFAKRAAAYYICRNDDPVAFAEQLSARGFTTALTFEPDPGQLTATTLRLRNSSAGELQRELQLPTPPEFILFGTLLTRETSVAPLRGVVMKQSFRLEFYDLRDRQSTVVEVAAQTLVQDSIETMVAELLRQRSN